MLGSAAASLPLAAISVCVAARDAGPCTAAPALGSGALGGGCSGARIVDPCASCSRCTSISPAGAAAGAGKFSVDALGTRALSIASAAVAANVAGLAMLVAAGCAARAALLALAPAACSTRVRSASGSHSAAVSAARLRLRLELSCTPGASSCDRMHACMLQTSMTSRRLENDSGRSRSCTNQRGGTDPTHAAIQSRILRQNGSNSCAPDPRPRWSPDSAKVHDPW